MLSGSRRKNIKNKGNFKEIKRRSSNKSRRHRNWNIKRKFRKNIKNILYNERNGTGLGVALSKEIIEQHHGTMNYQSEVGKGTKVNIFLPLKEKG